MLIFLCVIAALAGLVELDVTYGLIDSAITYVVLAFFAAGSALVLARLWRARGSIADIRRVGRSQVDVLPESWRRWILHED